MKVNESTLLHDTCKKQVLEKLIDITSAIAFFFFTYSDNIYLYPHAFILRQCAVPINNHKTFPSSINSQVKIVSLFKLMSNWGPLLNLPFP